MSTATLTSLLDYLTNALSINNKQWLADHLYQQVYKEKGIVPYTIEELQARVAESEAQYAAGEYYSQEEVHRMMDDYVI